MGQCYGREGVTSDESDSWKGSTSRKNRSSSRGFYSLHNNCLSSGTKNTLAFMRHQRGKLYIGQISMELRFTPIDGEKLQSRWADKITSTEMEHLGVTLPMFYRAASDYRGSLSSP